MQGSQTPVSLAEFFLAFFFCKFLFPFKIMPSHEFNQVENPARDLQAKTTSPCPGLFFCSTKTKRCCPFRKTSFFQTPFRPPLEFPFPPRLEQYETYFPRIEASPHRILLLPPSDTPPLQDQLESLRVFLNAMAPLFPPPSMCPPPLFLPYKTGRSTFATRCPFFLVKSLVSSPPSINRGFMFPIPEPVTMVLDFVIS